VPESTLTYALSYVRQNIPEELLDLAFKPTKFNTTIEQRIISEIIEGPILLDTNLVGGKRRDIFLQSNWIMELRRTQAFHITGIGVEGCYYLIPPEAREHRNLSSVIGISSFSGGSVSGSNIGMGQGGSYGNTANGMLSQMLNTRTMAQYAPMPQATLEGTNIIRFYPEVPADGVAVSVMLEYDAEFLNMNTSAIMAMQKLCLCAVQRYIATRLRVPIDETEVVAGMEIGIIKELVVQYSEKAEQYHELLMKLKGAMTYDARAFEKMIYYAL
jgi:hypothetical protein